MPDTTTELSQKLTAKRARRDVLARDRGRLTAEVARLGEEQGRALADGWPDPDPLGDALRAVRNEAEATAQALQILDADLVEVESALHQAALVEARAEHLAREDEACAAIAAVDPLVRTWTTAQLLPALAAVDAATAALQRASNQLDTASRAAGLAGDPSAPLSPVLSRRALAEWQARPGLREVAEHLRAFVTGEPRRDVAPAPVSRESSPSLAFR